MIFQDVAQRVLGPHAVTARVDIASLGFPAILVMFPLYQDDSAILLNTSKTRTATHLVMLVSALRVRPIGVQAIDLHVRRLPIQFLVQMDGGALEGTQWLERGKRTANGAL